MPRGPAPGWRARKQPVADAHVLASVQQAGGQFDPKTGFYGRIIMRFGPGDDPKVWHQALRRSARYLHRNGVADVGIHIEPLKRDAKGPYLAYVAVNKTHTYQYMLTKYGNDRSKWPYDPRRRGGTD